MQERNEASGGIHPARTLISEGKLIRTVTERRGRSFTTTTHVARGPIAFISTTTKNQIEVDDETRHISLWVDESEEQTKKIIAMYSSRQERLSRKELRVWWQVQRLVAKRARIQIRLPRWFARVGELAYTRNVRVRRYFPAFVDVCRTVCLLRSFQRYSPNQLPRRGIELDCVDFAIAAIIFESVFAESLHRGSGAALETRQAVEQIVSANGGKPIRAKDLAQNLGISRDRAYAQLRLAVESGTVRKVNPTEKSNRKLFAPSPLPRFIPDPLQVFMACKEIESPVKFIDPFTGQRVVYSRSRDDWES